MIPYGRQSVDQEDIDAVVEVLRSDWLTQGPAIERFERALAEYVGVKHAVAYSSATSALHGATWAAGLGPGDTVYTTPLTFIATVNSARYVGATPRLVDISEQTWNIDLALLPDDADAVIPVHYAGLPVNLVLPGWKKRPRVVIEDAAHALGAKTPGGPVGNCAQSDMTCFSFHPVKPITTGEGGMVTTNDDDLAERLRRFRSHGIVRKPERGEWYYEISDLGFNYRMTDIQAALGWSQLRKLDGFIQRRNEQADFYRQALKAMPIGFPPSAPKGYLHGYHLFPILVENRREVFDRMREKNIGVQVHYVPVHHHPISKPFQFEHGEFAVTELVYERLLSLPIHPGLKISDLESVSLALDASLG